MGIIKNVRYGDGFGNKIVVEFHGNHGRGECRDNIRVSVTDEVTLNREQWEEFACGVSLLFSESARGGDLTGSL